MNRGRVHLWTPEASSPLGGRVRTGIVPLPRLDLEGPGQGRLWGRHVRVRNAGVLNLPCDGNGSVGDARPNEEGDFLFDPEDGGPRVDRTRVPDPLAREQYVQASRFGEVNAYYHVDRIAAYVDELLRRLDQPSLPRVIAVVSAHPATVETRGVRDGVRQNGRWRPFHGGHYRLPGPRLAVREHELVSVDGEIHLGPGRERLEHGALVEACGDAYRHNASHNAGLLYHEYGHHIARHTADFQRNASRPETLQDNGKSALEEGFCDYVAATMLDSPHIWAWHRRHDDAVLHRRSLASAKTMADFDAAPDADPHGNSTIWAAALWDLRRKIGDPRTADLLVLKSLLLWRRVDSRTERAEGPGAFAFGLVMLLQADAELHASAHRAAVLAAFARRGIRPPAEPAASLRRDLALGLR